MIDDLVNDWVRSLDDTEDLDATPEEETMISIILSQRKRIEELEAELSEKMDEDDYIAELEYKMEAEEEKQAKVKDALSAFRDFEASEFRGVDYEKIKRAAYRGVKRKLLAALKMLEVK